MAVSVPPNAAAKMKLTPEIQKHLAGLTPVGGRGIDRSIFDGKPVLVKFFASW